ncbi:MAG: hypothetical protein JSS91_12290 [Bacteroidetes bacterium]|nr:hypothetical protein [Bacteroidota bacterium]
MKRVFVILLFILLSVSGKLFPQPYYSGESIYAGFGTSVSSYLGGYFGSVYQMRVLSSNTYYDNYSYPYSRYGSYYDNNYTVWSPVTFSFTLGKNLNEFAAIEAESEFLFHLNGRVDPEYKSGESGNRNYLDRNDYASLFAIPLSLCLKLSTGYENGSGAFFKIGPALQYTSEKYDRVREYYSYENFNSYSYDTYLMTVSKNKWLSGFKTGLGLKYYLSDFTYAVTELEYAYFKINGDNKTALALDRAPEAQLFSFSAKMYFDF